MRRLKSALLLGVSYLGGLILAIFYFVARALMILEIWYKQYVPYREQRMIIVLNHPKLLEAVFAPVLFINEWISAPGKWAPWSTPDQKNMKTKWYWFFWLAAGRAVRFPRGDKRGVQKALLRVLAILRAGGRVIVFPEGGRTWKGNEFRFSSKGKKIRWFKSAMCRSVERTGASVLPIWVDYAPLWHFFRRAPVIVKIGPLMRFPKGVSHREVTDTVEEALLLLADEGED